MVLRKYKISTFGETKRLIGDDSLIEPILFREKLYVYDESGKRIGRFSLNIDVEETDEDTHQILYVHVSNRAFVDGRLSETIVTGTVGPKLKTLEEIRYEGTEVSSSGKHERTMYLLRENTKYHVTVTNTICGLKSQSHSSIPFVEALGLIGESANAVLLRRLARKGYEGILCLKTVLSNGKRCRNYYVTKLSQQIVNGKRMQVLIVYRNLTNHKKCNLTMTMALTRAGQLIYLFWSNSKCFLHIDPDVELCTNRFTYGERRLDRQWQRDIQLYSMYLDKVDHQLLSNRSFKYQNEELRRILGDFIQYVLLQKPTDIVCFAIQFFSAFGRNSSKRCPSKQRPADVEDLYEYDEYEGQDERRTFQMWIGEGEYLGGP